MITFTLSLVALVLGYFFYGRVVEHVFGPDDRETPAVAKADGLDYIVLPNWKIFMIQFLNIAGTGPIFGAIMGAKFGPVACLWIVFGCIFAGATHDYLSGMLSALCWCSPFCCSSWWELCLSIHLQKSSILWVVIR